MAKVDFHLIYNYGFIKNFSLLLAAFVLAPILIPTGVITAFAYSAWRLDYSMLYKYLTRLFFYIAFCLDKIGNYACAILFNITLIKSSEKAYRFGKTGETISYCIGKNLLVDNLTIAGKALNSILDFFEKDHSILTVAKGKDCL